MISELVSFLLDLLTKYGERFASRLCAYLLAPMVVGTIVWAQSGGGVLAGDESQPFSISPLRTEVTSDGHIHRSGGAAILIEPTTASYRIPLLSNAAQIWTSLNEEQAIANKDRLRFDGKSIGTTSPFLNVTDPVTVVVKGPIGPEIEMPGGSNKTSEFMQEAERASSFVSYVLLSCAFAFGLSLATGFAPGCYQPAGDHKNARRQKGA
jgi:hypothetical protein